MTDAQHMRLALRLARRGYGATSPNPMVGAVLVKNGRVIGHGWHHRAGLPHAEIEALRDAEKRGHSPRGATLYVTLEPCSTHGRTPPCTRAILEAGIKHVVVGTTDPNPRHAGKAFKILRMAGVKVTALGEATGKTLFHRERRHLAGEGRLSFQKLAEDCARLNEAFNHWIVHRTPFVTVKAAMTLDGKIATASGESKWITGEAARASGMSLRQGSDAILVGVNTVLADDPALTVRSGAGETPVPLLRQSRASRRIVLDSLARTPLTAKVVCDDFSSSTTIVVSKKAPKNRISALAKKAKVLVAPLANSSFVHLPWLLKKLGSENVTSLLVEGGGEVNASFLMSGLAHRVAFFYAPKVLGGRDARRGVAGDGAKSLRDVLELRDIEWRQIGDDLFLTALVQAA